MTNISNATPYSEHGPSGTMGANPSGIMEANHLETSENGMLRETFRSPDSSGISLPGGTSELKRDGTGIADSTGPGLLISPVPGFVIKTHQEARHESNVSAEHEQQGTKLFINVCSSNAVAEPGQKKKLDADGNEVEGLNMPLSIGNIREAVDNTGRPSNAVDCIVNPSILAGIESDKTGSYRDFICQLLIQSVEQKYGDRGSLDRKYKLPRVKYHSYVDSRTGEVVEKNSQHAEVAKQFIRDRSKRPQIEEIESTATKAKRAGQTSRPATPPSKAPCHPIPLQIMLENNDGGRIDFFEYVDEWNKLADRESLDAPDSPQGPLESFRLLATMRNKDQGDLSPSQLLEVPLLCNPAAHGNSPLPGRELLPAVCSLCVLSHVPCVDASRIQVDVSAFMISVSSESFARTECVLPFEVIPSTARCTFDEKESTLTIFISLSRSPVDDNTDIGSQPWILKEAQCR